MDIVITDVQLHTIKARKPKPVWRVIQKAIHTKREQQAYTTDGKLANGKWSFIYQDPGIQKIIQEAQAQGKGVRFFRHKEGIDVRLGQDAEEFAEARERKAQRVGRGV
ncbi:MAG: hypothetical protein PHV43_01980 [Candidatus Colwellbacteria bacterium]|nr:hypothetical protein [Candidatus Colwellbacteria bacterium]